MYYLIGIPDEKKFFSVEVLFAKSSVLILQLFDSRYPTKRVD